MPVLGVPRKKTILPKKKPIPKRPLHPERGPLLPEETLTPVPGTGGGPVAVAPLPRTVGDLPAIRPNPMDEILADPVYQAALKRYQSSITGGASQVREALRGLVHQYGFDPRSGLPAAAEWLDPTSVQAALENPQSMRAQLERARGRGLNELAYELAARGTAGSGAYAAGAGGIQEAYETQGYQQMGNLLEALRGGLGQYQTLQAQAEAEREQAMGEAAGRLAAQPGAGPEPPVEAAPAAPAAPAAVAKGPITWGGRQFTRKADLARYITQTRGGYRSLDAWARDHPTAFARLI